MGFQDNGRPESTAEVKTNRARDLRSTAFISEKGPETRCGLSKPLYGLETSCREWRETLKSSLTEKLAGAVNLLGNWVFPWAEKQLQYGFGEGLRDKHISDTAKCIFDVDGDFGEGVNINAIVMAKSHLRDLLISRSVILRRFPRATLGRVRLRSVWVETGRVIYV